MKTHFKIPVGEKIKIFSVSSFVPDNFNLEPVKGENYYFGMDCNFGACWFDKLSKEEYNSIAETCSKDLVIEQGAPEYTLTINQTGTASGRVSNNPTGKRFSRGAVVTLTATPDSSSNFAGWSEACTGGSASCSLTMNSNLATTATFNLKTFTINATVTGNGTISPQGMVSVNYRASQRFFITPAAGYKVNDVRIDGVSIGAVSSYVFGNIKADHAITASFSPRQ